MPLLFPFCIAQFNSIICITSPQTAVSQHTLCSGFNLGDSTMACELHDISQGTLGSQTYCCIIGGAAWQKSLFNHSCNVFILPARPFHQRVEVYSVS